MSILSTQFKFRVAIAKDSDPYKATIKALNLVNDDFTVDHDDRIVIKPNIVRAVPPEEGITTDARVVEAIIEHLKGKGVDDIVIAEGGNPGTDKAFKKLGFKDLEERYGVGLVNLNKDKWELVQIPDAVALNEVKIAKTVLECDGIINVPKLKIHHMSQITLSLKNLMGVIVDNRGSVMHDMLDEKIVDLASLFKPVLNVVDGIVGAEMDEVVGDPVESNIVLAGLNMVSVDAVSSAVMGLDPGSIRHVQQATMRGLGVAGLDRITVLGEPIEAVVKNYSTAYSERKLKTYGLANPLSEEEIVYMRNRFAKRIS